MERLTQRGFNFDRDFVATSLQSWPIAQALKKLQQIEDAMEDREQGKTYFDRITASPEMPHGTNSSNGHTARPVRRRTATQRTAPTRRIGTIRHGFWRRM